MRRLLRAVAALWLGLTLGSLGAAALAETTASPLASLVADSLTISSKTVLTATGQVEIFYLGRHLTAESLTYDRSTDRLLIGGPIWIDDGLGNVLRAEMADLSADLTEGILRSARLVLAERLQLAAGEVLQTAGGRYTALRSVAASSCTICKGSSTPLWEIRADSVVHDTVEHQIWFSGAQLRFAGVPVIYLPILRVPDPDLTRATGFLLPVIRTTTLLGTGVYIPYFVKIGDSRDLTITPYLTTSKDRTVNLRYREAYRTGFVTINGAVSDDDLMGPGLRGFLQAEGTFKLPQDFVADFNLIGVSDPAYLLDYGISDTDRLQSTIEISRAQRNAWISAAANGFQSLREGDLGGTSPSATTDFTLNRRFSPAILGGTGGFVFQTHTSWTPSTDPLDTNGDGMADGSDQGRLSARLDWQRNWLLTSGIQVTTGALLSADEYLIAQDAVYEGDTTRLAGTAGVELRWPWSRAGRSVTQLIEPVVQFVVSPRTTASVPNMDSTLVEFDEGNLFTFDRFPGADEVETGLRANLGVNYEAIFADGYDFGLTAGRVLRLNEPVGFPPSSGLDAQFSDWMIAVNLSDGTNDGLQLTNRIVLGDRLGLTKEEFRMDMVQANYDLAIGYSFVEAAMQESRPDPISELVLDGRYDLTATWTIRGASRYNVADSTFSQAGAVLTFRNECLNVDVSLSRRFTSSTTVQPSTDFGLAVELLGFGGSGLPGPARQCRQ